MKTKITGYGRGNKQTDCRVRAGKVELRAEDDFDAQLLAMFYRAMHDIWTPKKGEQGRIRLFKALREIMENPDEHFDAVPDLPEECPMCHSSEDVHWFQSVASAQCGECGEVWRLEALPAVIPGTQGS